MELFYFILSDPSSEVPGARTKESDLQTCHAFSIRPDSDPNKKKKGTETQQL
jgi:hypothetical protein